MLNPGDGTGCSFSFYLVEFIWGKEMIVSHFKVPGKAIFMVIESRTRELQLTKIAGLNKTEALFFLT